MFHILCVKAPSVNGSGAVVLSHFRVGAANQRAGREVGKRNGGCVGGE